MSEKRRGKAVVAGASSCASGARLSLLQCSGRESECAGSERSTTLFLTPVVQRRSSSSPSSMAGVAGSWDEAVSKALIWTQEMR